MMGQALWALVRRLLRLLSGICICASVALTAPLEAAGADAPAATTTWGEAQQIPSSLPAWFPDIAFDQAGTTHIIWNTSQATGPTTASQGGLPQQAANLRDFLMYEPFGTAGADPPATDIAVSSNTFGEAMRNSIIADQDGTLDVLYRAGQHIWFIKAPIPDSASAHFWSEPRLISGSGPAYYDAIAQDASGVLHAVYSESMLVDTQGGGAATFWQGINYRRSSDGGRTWSKPVRLSAPTSLHGATRPQVRINGTTVVVVWDDGYDNISGAGDPAGGAMRRSLDGGKSWEPLQLLTDPDGPIEQVTFSFSQDNHALLVWRETNKDVLRFRMSDTAGDTWGNIATVPNIVARPYYTKHQFDRYALASDNTGRYHLLAVGQTGQADKVALFHLELRDGVWSAPQTVYGGTGFPEYPGIATDGGNRMAISFFVRDSIWDIGDYRIWHAEAIMDAPAVARQSVPIPTPIPTATLSQIAASPQTADALPTPQPGTLAPDQRPSIERPPPVVSVGSGLPVIFALLILIGISRFIWMRRL